MAYMPNAPAIILPRIFVTLEGSEEIICCTPEYDPVTQSSVCVGVINVKSSFSAYITVLKATNGYSFSLEIVYRFAQAV